MSSFGRLGGILHIVKIVINISGVMEINLQKCIEFKKKYFFTFRILLQHHLKETQIPSFVFLS